MKSEKRAGLALLLVCEIETPQLNASKLTIKTWRLVSACKLL